MSKKKVLILTDQRCGGTSFQAIISSFLSKKVTAIDDPLTHFYKIKNEEQSWIKDLVSVDIKNYYNKYSHPEKVDLFDLINFLYSGNINTIKISINSITKKQFDIFSRKIKRNKSFFIITLSRRNQFAKILSLCKAYCLKEKIGDKAYDIIDKDYIIKIPEEMFIREIKKHEEFLFRLKSIKVRSKNVFYYEDFFSKLSELKRLKELLGVEIVQNPEYLCYNLLKNYNGDRVIVENYNKLKYLLEQEN